MTNFLKIGVAVAALLAGAAPAAAQVAPSAAVSPDKQAKATARIVKPLKLYHVQDLDLGSIILSGAGAWTGAVVGISRGGVFSCTDSNVTCTGDTSEAQYKVTGTNNQTVTVNVSPTIDLVHGVDATKKLAMAVDSPGSVALGNSGVAGYTFGLGGSVVVNADTLDGTYTGTFDVTVEY